MRHVKDVNVERRWEEVGQRGSGRLYAALRVDGVLSISGWTHERMGEPDGYLLLFDRGGTEITPASITPSAQSGGPPSSSEEGSFGQPSSGRKGVIGLKAARMGVDKNAYRVSKQKPGTNRNRTIFARPLCEEFGIRVERTIVFRGIEIDRDGVLILSLDDVRILPARATKEPL